MSEPPTIEYAPTPPTPPLAPRRPGGRIAWALILLTVGYMLLATILPAIRGRAPAEEGSSDPQLTLVVKYLLGVRSFINSPSDQLVKQVDTAAKTPMQKLHAAVFAGELQGADTAIERLDTLQTQSPSLEPDIDDFRAVYINGPETLDPERRDRLVDRHQFFARLALIHGRPDTDPQRQALINDSLFAAGAFIAFLALGALAGLAGFVLLIIAIIMYLDGSLRRAYTPPQHRPDLYVEIFAAYLAGFVLLSIGLALILGDTMTLGWSWLLTIAVPIAFAWGIARGLSWEEIRHAVGWHTGRGLIVEIPMGMVGYLAGLPVVALGFGITYVLILLAGTTPTHPVQQVEVDTSVSILLLYSIASVWAPVIEETMFRGALYSHLRAGLGWVASGLIVGVIFAAIHPQGWTFIPVLAAIGFVFAALREWRGSILAPMTAHALNNFVMISLLVAVK